MTTSSQFTLLYDRDCPFCRLEVDWLRRRKHAQLDVINIADGEFDPTVHGLTMKDVEDQLHGITPDGKVVIAMDAVRASYDAAGIGWMMRWTRWLPFRWFADLGYRIFARHRIRLGRLFGRSCEQGACAIDPPVKRES